MKTTILFSSKQFTCSTLLIPVRMLPVFDRQKKIYGSIGFLLKNVLLKGKAVVPGLQGSRSGKIVYQKPEPMERINFRPMAKDWEMLRNLAYAKRISMTYMFVLLLLGMINGGGGVVPTIPDKVLLNYTYISNENFTFLELERLTP